MQRRRKPRREEARRHHHHQQQDPSPQPLPVQPATREETPRNQHQRQLQEQYPSPLLPSCPAMREEARHHYHHHHHQRQDQEQAKRTRPPPMRMSPFAGAPRLDQCPGRGMLRGKTRVACLLHSVRMLTARQEEEEARSDQLGFRLEEACSGQLLVRLEEACSVQLPLRLGEDCSVRVMMRSHPGSPEEIHLSQRTQEARRLLQMRLAQACRSIHMRSPRDIRMSPPRAFHPPRGVQIHMQRAQVFRTPMHPLSSHLRTQRGPRPQVLIQASRVRLQRKVQKATAANPSA